MNPLLPVSEMIAALPLAALAVGPTEQVIAINGAGCKLFGDGVVGRHFITVLRQPSVAEAIETCLGGGPPTTARYLARENGQDVDYDVSAGCIGNSGIVLLTFVDVTDVTAAGQMRRDFVANVSHELRTPLTALMGFIETLQGPARDDAVARARFLSIMRDEAERMNRLVGELLTLSRVEASQRVRPKDTVDLGAVLGTTVRTLDAIAQAANVTLAIETPDEALTVLADKDQLVQVFTNLIENAIKYGGRDRTVHVDLTRATDCTVSRGPYAQVRVRDEGPGIDPVHLPRLTERFYRVDSHRSRALGGTGLGLAIAKHILNRHRGYLKIASRLGEGAEFTVFIPVAEE